MLAVGCAHRSSSDGRAELLLQRGIPAAFGNAEREEGCEAASETRSHFAQQRPPAAPQQQPQVGPGSSTQQSPRPHSTAGRAKCFGMGAPYSAPSGTDGTRSAVPPSPPSCPSLTACGAAGNTGSRFLCSKNKRRCPRRWQTARFPWELLAAGSASSAAGCLIPIPAAPRRTQPCPKGLFLQPGSRLKKRSRAAAQLQGSSAPRTQSPQPAAGSALQGQQSTQSPEAVTPPQHCSPGLHFDPSSPPTAPSTQTSAQTPRAWLSTAHRVAVCHACSINAPQLLSEQSWMLKFVSTLQWQRPKTRGGNGGGTYQICRIVHYSLLYPSLRYVAERESRAESEFACRSCSATSPPPPQIKYVWGRAL